jgi:aryl-alcohol dehydrogenase-like predicted oxidoreductase
MTPTTTRTLGDLTVPPMGLGCMGMSAFYGTKRRTYLEDNVGALDVELTADDLARLDELPQAAGDRYDRTGMQTVNR